MKRTLWRTLLWLRFHLLQRHRFNRLIIETVRGKPFLILPQVFNPTLFLTSEFMVQTLSASLIPVGATVLDMGTGSGIGAVFATEWAEQVTAVDINPHAVRCARINILLNQRETQIEVHQSDLFTALEGQTFDVILFNPPYFPGQPQNWLDHAFRAEGVLERFALEAPHHLRPDGSILLLLSSDAPIANILTLFTDQGFKQQLIAEHNLVSERVQLYQLKQ